MIMKLVCAGVFLICSLNAMAISLTPGPWTATSDKGTASMAVNPDGTIQEIRIDGFDSGNPHFGVIDASYVLGRGYDWLEWTGNDFVAGFYSAVYTPPNNPTSAVTHAFRVVGTAISADRIEATWSVYGSDSYVDAAGDWQYEQYAMQGGTFSANAGGSGRGLLTPVQDFDGDSKSDLTVYDADAGEWAIQLSGGGPDVTGLNWGTASSVPVLGDFDGDGAGDLAVLDRPAGRWYVRSLAGTPIVWHKFFGWPGTIPVSGDYDGDGADDRALLDQRSGHWFIMKGSNDTVIAWDVNWGWPGANSQPVPGDYDGDGTDDLAFLDQNTGGWFIRTLGGTQLAVNVSWGWPGIQAVPGDYDGDGASDLAVFDQNTGRWFIRALGGTPLAIGTYWGWPGARPVSGDFDGDGTDDLAVFDEVTGRWYIRSVAGNVIAWHVYWGR